jgi:hypothetical protein
LGLALHAQIAAAFFAVKKYRVRVQQKKPSALAEGFVVLKIPS